MYRPGSSWMNLDLFHNIFFIIIRIFQSNLGYRPIGHSWIKSLSVIITIWLIFPSSALRKLLDIFYAYAYRSCAVFFFYSILEAHFYDSCFTEYWKFYKVRLSSFFGLWPFYVISNVSSKLYCFEDIIWANFGQNLMSRTSILICSFKKCTAFIHFLLFEKISKKLQNILV